MKKIFTINRIYGNAVRALAIIIALLAAGGPGAGAQERSAFTPREIEMDLHGHLTEGFEK